MNIQARERLAASSAAAALAKKNAAALDALKTQNPDLTGANIPALTSGVSTSTVGNINTQAGYNQEIANIQSFNLLKASDPVSYYNQLFQGYGTNLGQLVAQQNAAGTDTSASQAVVKQQMQNAVAEAEKAGISASTINSSVNSGFQAKYSSVANGIVNARNAGGGGILGTALGSILGVVSSIVVAVVAPELAPAIGAELGLTGAAATAAGTAAIGGSVSAVTTAANGGNAQQIATAGLEGAAAGAVGSSASTIASQIAPTVGSDAASIIANAATSAAKSAITGGNVLASAAGGAAGTAASELGGNVLGGTVGGAAKAAVGGQNIGQSAAISGLQNFASGVFGTTPNSNTSPQQNAETTSTNQSVSPSSSSVDATQTSASPVTQEQIDAARGFTVNVTGTRDYTSDYTSSPVTYDPSSGKQIQQTEQKNGAYTPAPAISTISTIGNVLGGGGGVGGSAGGTNQGPLASAILGGQPASNPADATGSNSPTILGDGKRRDVWNQESLRGALGI